MLNEIQHIKTVANLFGKNYPSEPVKFINTKTLFERIKNLTEDSDVLLSAFGRSINDTSQTDVNPNKLLYSLTIQINSLLNLALETGLIHHTITAINSLHSSEMSRFWSVDQLKSCTVPHIRVFQVKKDLFVVWDSVGKIVNPPTYIPFNELTCCDIINSEEEAFINDDEL